MNKKIVCVIFICCLISGAVISCESLKPALDSIAKSISDTAAGIGSGDFASAKYDPDKRGDPDTANRDIAALDTAKDADYLTGVEKNVILEMNKVRNNPGQYAELYIKLTLKYYHGKNYSEPGQITIVTQEGAQAVSSCISALLVSRKAGVLQPDRGISLVAKDRAVDQSKTGKTGHYGSDGSSPFQRMERYGGGYSTAGENCAYGPNRGRDIVVQFLIDDGVPSRGHRKNIMSTDFNQAGVSIQTHPQFRYCCVIDYAKNFVDK